MIAALFVSGEAFTIDRSPVQKINNKKLILKKNNITTRTTEISGSRGTNQTSPTISFTIFSGKMGCYGAYIDSFYVRSKGVIINITLVV